MKIIPDKAAKTVFFENVASLDLLPLSLDATPNFFYLNAIILFASLEVCLPEAFVSKFVSLGFFGLMITK